MKRSGFLILLGFICVWLSFWANKVGVPSLEATVFMVGGIIVFAIGWKQ